MSCFRDLKDPRTGNRTTYDLVEIVMISICALLSGAKGPTGIARFAAAREAWLRRFFKLEAGVPSHDTVGRLFRLIDPEAFSSCFGLFVRRLAAAFPPSAGIAINGKVSRGARRADGSALCMLTAWSRDLRLVLGQVAVDDKSNESAAIPALLGLLDLRGTLVTIDAAGTTRPIAQALLDKKADYVLRQPGDVGQGGRRGGPRTLVGRERTALGPGRRLREDLCRIRRDHGPRNMAVMRHFAVNLLKADPLPDTVAGKMERCAWSTDYLERVLRQVPAEAPGNS